MGSSMVATDCTLLSRTTASESFTCAEVNAKNFCPPSFVKLKPTAGWPFSSVEERASRRSRPVTAATRETTYQEGPPSEFAELEALPGIKTPSGGKTPLLACNAACSLGYGPPRDWRISSMAVD